MKLADAKRYLRELIDAQPLLSIGVHGGEPFLYFKLLKKIMENAKKFGVTHTWVITNGFWAETKAIAEEKLLELNEAGLKSITFSVDGFHQEHIPFENVERGIQAAVSVGFEKVWVDSYFLGSFDSKNSFNNMTRKALESLETLDDVEINKRLVDFEGRAAEFLTEYVESKPETPTGKCPMPFWIGGDLRNPEVVEIDYEGNVTLCPGICIGNTKRKSLTQILEDYDYRSHPILSIITEEGPIGVLKMAMAKGFKRKKFVDECHLCYEARRFLRRYYPQYLAPANCYSERKTYPNS